MATKRKPTINTGAVIERDLIRRWARRKLSTIPDVRASTVLQELLVWLDLQRIRTKRKGGLGR